MNKFKGSIFVKVLAWILATASAIGLTISIILFVVLEEEDVFSKTIIQNYDEKYDDITEALAKKAVYYSLRNDSPVDLSGDGFEYAILKKQDYDNGNYSNILYTSLSKNNNIENLKSVTVKYTPTAFIEDYDSLLYKNYWISYDDGGNYRYCPGLIYYRPTGLFYYRDEDDNYYIARNIVLRNSYTKTYEDYYEEPNEEDFNEENFDEENFDEEVYLNNFEETDEAVYVYMSYDEKSGHYVETDTDNQVDPYDTINHWDGMWLDEAWKFDTSQVEVYESPSPYIEMSIKDDIVANMRKQGNLKVESEVQEYVVLALVDEKLWSHEKTLSIAELWQNFMVRSDYISDYEFADNAILVMYSIQDGILITAAISLVILLLCLTYLFCAAGHRKNQEEIQLLALDKVPFDIFTFLMLMIYTAPIAILAEVMDAGTSKYVKIYITIAMCIVMWLLLLWYLLSTTVRVKAKRLVKNTFIFKVFSFCWRGIKRFGKWLYDSIKKMMSYISSFWMIVIIFIILGFFDILAIAEEFSGFFIFGMLLKILALGALLKLLYDYRKLAKAGQELSKGNLEYKVDTDRMYHEEKELGENLNNIADGLNKAVEGRMRSERMKTELITNVSHDIKTPLTSIVNYVDLLGKEETDNANIKEYVEVLDRQATRLKKLIEDLVEASKASTGNLTVNMETIDASVIISQVAGEFEEKLASNELELIVRKPEPPVDIVADGRHLWRVIDNLINNICKYAQPNSRVYIDLENNDADVRIILRNISKYQLNISGEELLERFVRGDESRNTEGHGLGLSIAKSLMELMGGKLDIMVDGDLFKVILILNKA